MGWKKMVLIMTSIPICWIGTQTHAAFGQPIGLMPPQVSQKKQSNYLSIPGGRYVFGQVSDSSKDQFMLDVATGRLWRISETGEVGLFLNPVPYRVPGGKYSPLPGEPSEVGDKEPKKRQ